MQTWRWLRSLGLEGVARPDISRIKAALEPVHPLFGTAMCEGFRRYLSLRLPLQPVIADRRRRCQTLVDIAGLKDPPRTIGKVPPDARQTIGLELLANRQLIGAPR